MYSPVRWVGEFGPHWLAWLDGPGCPRPIRSPGSMGPAVRPQASRCQALWGRWQKVSTIWVWCLCSGLGLIGCPMNPNTHSTRHLTSPSASSVDGPADDRGDGLGEGPADGLGEGPGDGLVALAAELGGLAATGWPNWPRSMPAGPPAPTRAPRPPPPPAGSAPGSTWAPARPAAVCAPPGRCSAAPDRDRHGPDRP
jgi:hypothetical protein